MKCSDKKCKGHLELEALKTMDVSKIEYMFGIKEIFVCDECGRVHNEKGGHFYFQFDEEDNIVYYDAALGKFVKKEEL